MKISFYEAFDLIADEAVDLLMKDSSNETIMPDFPADTTINNVMEKVTKGNRIGKRKSTRAIRLLVAILVILALSTTVYAITQGLSVKDGGAELLTDSNRNLIGKESKGESTIKDSVGTIVDQPETADYEPYDWRTSSVIKSIQKNAHIPRAISEFTVVDEDDFFTTPEIIFTNDCMVILKKEDGSGWYLEKGDLLNFKVELFPSEVNPGKGQNIIYQYIQNGKLMKQSFTDDGLVQNYSIKADKAGEYYICLTGASSDPISLKQGEILIK